MSLHARRGFFDSYLSRGGYISPNVKAFGEVGSRRGNKSKEKNGTMEKTAKKIGLALGIVACAIFIGTSVAGWVGKKDDNKKDDSTNQTAVVHVIEA